jgi:hypothetical protein
MKPAPNLAAVPVGHSTFRERSFFDLIRTAKTKTIIQAAVAVIIAWIPAAILSAVRGWEPLSSFLTDIATQSRVFLVIPLLILAEPKVHERLEAIIRQFTTAGLIADSDLPAYQANWESFKKLHGSVMSKIAIVLLVSVIILSVQPYLTSDALLPWTTGGGGWHYFSPAGVWFLWVIHAIVFYLFLLWFWRMLLWTRFLRSVSRLDLQLIPAHPDHNGGLGFVDAYLRRLLPFAFSIGVIVAGGVANRITHANHPLLSFKYIPVFVVVTVLIICAAPLCVFVNTLLRIRHRGVFEYGALAVSMGQQFEKKWLRRNKKVDEEALEEQGFSATTDLYSIVHNVQEIRLVPIGISNLYSLIAFSLLPAVPVVLIAVPFDVLVQHLIKLVF